jgi:hypothetical protein
MCHTLLPWVSYFDDRHNIVGRVLELAHVDIEVTQLVLLRLLQHQVAPLAHSIDALQVAGGVEVGVRSSRQRNMRNTRGGCGVLGHGGVFGVAVERKGRVAVVGRVFVAGSAVVAVVPAGEEAHVIGCACIIMQLVPYLGWPTAGSCWQCGAARVDLERRRGRRLSGACYLLQYRYRGGVYVRGWCSEDQRRGGGDERRKQQTAVEDSPITIAFTALGRRLLQESVHHIHRQWQR